jgi:hypothetical protein
VAHPQVDTFIVVGDCTDLCTYQLAMYLKLRANAHQLRQRVIVPENTTDTFDIPVLVAEKIGAVPHDGDLLHLIFLYNMMENGVMWCGRSSRARDRNRAPSHVLSALFGFGE